MHPAVVEIICDSLSFTDAVWRRFAVARPMPLVSIAVWCSDILLWSLVLRRRLTAGWRHATGRGAHAPNREESTGSWSQLVHYTVSLCENKCSWCRSFRSKAYRLHETHYLAGNNGTMEGDFTAAKWTFIQMLVARWGWFNNKRDGCCILICRPSFMCLIPSLTCCSATTSHASVCSARYGELAPS
jgi:hypothetical protein